MRNIGQNINLMNGDDVTNMLDEAVTAMLDAGCRVIQDRIGQTDGGVADLHFTDEHRDRLYEMMRLYFISEKNMEAV